MRYRRVGKAGIRVSEIGLGTYLTFAESVDDAAARRITARAVERGVNHIDMADIYAKGRVETLVGGFLREVPRHKLVLATKTAGAMSDDPNDRGLSRKHIFESVHGSLKRLGTEYIDIYYAHAFDEHTRLDETVQAFDDLVRQGKVLYWATSNFGPKPLEITQKVVAAMRAAAPIAEQCRYNPIDRFIEREIVPQAVAAGMGIVVYSPLAGGLLTGKYAGGRKPARSRGALTKKLDLEFTPDILQRIDQLAALARDVGTTAKALSLAWALTKPWVSSLLCGATDPAHIDEAVDAAGMRLDPEVVRKLEILFPL